MNKKLGLLIVLTLLTQVFIYSPASAADEKELSKYFANDIDENYWAYGEIDNFLAANFIDGFKDASGNVYVQPNDPITRAQFSKMLVTSLRLGISSGQPKTFSDVAQNKWYSHYIDIASVFGIVRGSGDKFYPDRYITREEMAVMIVRAFRYIEPQGESLSFKDVPATHWAVNEINKASSAGIINGYGSLFKPKELATRAQAIVMLTRGMLVDTAHAPTEDYIINVMTDFINQENVHYDHGTYEELPALYDKYTRGYFRTLSLYWKNYWQALKDNGTNVVFETSDDVVVTPYYISSHIAIVEVTGFTYSYTIDGGETVTTNSDGEYYLTKSPDGSWKVYNYYSFD